MEQGIAGQWAAHGMTHQVCLVGTGGGEDALHMVGHLLRQRARIDGRRCVADGVNIVPAAALELPLHPQEVGAVATVTVDQDGRRFTLLARAYRRGIVQQAQRIGDHQQAQRQPLHHHADAFLGTRQLDVVARQCSQFGKIARLVIPAGIEAEGDSAGCQQDSSQRQPHRAQQHHEVVPPRSVPPQCSPVRVSLTLTIVPIVRQNRTGARRSARWHTAQTPGGDMKEAIIINEVGLRDGLQNQPVPISTADTLLLAESLVNAGARYFEPVSYSHPKAVPQMADASALAKQLPWRDDLHYTAMVPNMKGYERAREDGFGCVALLLSTTDSFNQRNLNMSRDQAMQSCVDIIARARADG